MQTQSKALKWNEGEASEDNKELELTKTINKQNFYVSYRLSFLSETCKNSFAFLYFEVIFEWDFEKSAFVYLSVWQWKLYLKYLF